MGLILLSLFSLFTLLIAYLVYSARKIKNHFESKGIPYQGNGTIRLILNSFKGINIMEDISIQYNKARKEGKSVMGAYDFGLTTIILLNPDLYKSVFVKDFDHFSDRRTFSLPKHDWMFNKMLVALTGEKWRALRSKLSPTFTTGKIKRLFNLFDESGKKLVKYVETEMAISQKGEIDLSEGYSKYTMDVIASAACGIDSKAFDQKEPSLFEQMGKKMQLQVGGLQLLRVLIVFTSHKLANILGISFFGKDVQDFFQSVITGSIKHRQETKERRNDFIQLMLEAREGLLKTEESELDAFEKDAMLKLNPQEESDKVSADILDDDGIVSNAVLFIIAGFDTTQSLLLFCAYALALNQDVQDKLREEVSSVLEENDGEFTYDSMNKITYLDMVINETLRMYPPAPATDRGCTIEYKVPGTDYILKKGEGIVVPIYGIHHDPEYYPNPGKFDPERFSSENKGNIKPYTFMPFGQGPRNCIGMRFALAEVKVAISHLVHNFRIEPSSGTLIPMKFSKTSSLKPEGGMFLSLNKIQH